MADIPTECSRCGFRGAVSSYAENKIRNCLKCGEEICFILPDEEIIQKPLKLKSHSGPGDNWKSLTQARVEKAQAPQPKRSLLKGLFKRS